MSLPQKLKNRKNCNCEAFLVLESHVHEWLRILGKCLCLGNCATSMQPINLKYIKLGNNNRNN